MLSKNTFETAGETGVNGNNDDSYALGPEGTGCNWARVTADGGRTKAGPR